MKKIIALLIVALLAFSAIPAASMAKGFGPDSYLDNDEYLTETDREKLLAFWSIVNPETELSNGEAVFVTDYPTAWLDEIGGHEYTGTALTPLVSFVIGTESPCFDFRFCYELLHDEPLPGGAPGEMACTVYPNLFGTLDLSGTSVHGLASPDLDHQQIMIDAIELNDCAMLANVQYLNDRNCHSFSALNCPMLSAVSLINGGFKNIEVQPAEYEKTLELSSFGNGRVGYEYYWRVAKIYAYSDSETFIGWFEDGELISTEPEFAYEDGGKVIACFGGDADGDGSITVSDAMLALRMSMGVASVDPSDIDVNGNGAVEVADAIMIMRFAMGLL